MKSLQKFIIGSFLSPFIASVVILTFLFTTWKLLQYIEELSGSGVGLFPILEVMFFFSFNMVPRIMPLAILVTSLILFGNLGQHNELTAIKSAGVSLLKLIKPLFVLVSLLTLGTYLFSNYVLPKTNLRAYSLLHDITHTKVFDIPEGRFYSGLDNYRLKVDKKNPETGALYGVTIYRHGEDEGLTLADSGKMYKILDDQYLVLELYHGAEYRKTNQLVNSSSEKQQEGFLRMNFDKSKVVIKLTGFGFKETPQNQFSTHRYMKDIDELTTSIDSLANLVQQMGMSVHYNIATSYFMYHFKNDSLPYTIYPDTLSLTDFTKKDIIQKSLSQTRGLVMAVKAFKERVDYVKEERNRDEVEMYYKFTHPFACLVMFLIGAPIGAIIKKGGLGIPSLVTIIFFIIYYVLHMTGEKYAKEGVYPVPISMWAANAILLPIGLFFLWQARNDSRLFEVPVWIKNFYDYLRNTFSRSKK